MSAESEERDEMLSSATAVASEEDRGRQIGPYQVVRRIGEGVAGIVYEGEQQEPRQQRVAVKVIKEGRDWQQVVDRFEAKWHALSQIDHPHIAKVLGSGTRASGQPYFVLELVEGLPITRHCDERQLPLKPRLALFITVCRAVQYAHQKGLIHGDLKPSNVLMAGEGEEPAPKILDFIIAQATRQNPNENDPSLDPATRGAKPEYLSPEQAGSDTADIDTRSDVYSLGVLLYELLTGTTPLDPEELKDVSRKQVLRLIREKDFPQPSDRLTDSDDRLSSVAKRRQVKPRKLVSLVRDGLDCVVMKALEKDRDNRYETVHELARDVERYLAGKPLEASPASRRKLWKWAKTSPRPVVTTGLAIVLLFGFLVGTSFAIWKWYDAHEAEMEAKEANHKRAQAEEHGQKLADKLKKTQEAAEIRKKERDQARQAEKAAEDSEHRTNDVLDFVRKQFMSAARPGDRSVADAFWAGTRRREDATARKDVTLREVVDEAESKVGQRFAKLPREEATVREMLGFAYLNLGDAAKAVDQYKRAFELRLAVQGVSDLDAADCRNQLAVAYRLAGRADEAAALFHLTPNSTEHGAALAAHAVTLLLENKPAEAELKFRESLKLRQKTKPDDWTTFETQSLVGECLLEEGEYADAEPLLLAGYKGMKEHEDDIPAHYQSRLTAALARLARLYEAWGKLTEAARWRAELEIAMRPKG